MEPINIDEYIYTIYGNNEVWRKIRGYNYSVSSFGNVRNDKTGRILEPGINYRGYSYVNLCNGVDKQKAHTVHRLVARAFLPNLEKKKCVDHIDHNGLNNNISNLRWATLSENQWNTVKRCDNKSGYKGVFFHKQSNKYRAEITICGKRKYLGVFKTALEASEVYQAKAKESFVFLNLIGVN